MSKKMAAEVLPLKSTTKKNVAAGNFLSEVFMKREGRPSTDATLTARLIDRRSVNVLEGFRNEVPSHRGPFHR